MIDMRSVLIVQMLIYVVCFFVLLQVWIKHRNRYKGIEYWAAMMFCYIMGLLLIFLRGRIPDFWSIVAGNFTLEAGLVLFVFGLRLFYATRFNNIFNVIVLIISTSFMSYFTFASPDLMLRIVITNSAFVLLYSRMIWILLKKLSPDMRRISMALVWNILFIIAICLYRLIMTLFFPPVSQDFFQQNLFEVSFTLLNNLAVLYLVMNLTIMVSRRLLFEIMVEESKFNTIFYASPYAAVMTRVADSKIIEINAEMLDLMGYSAEETLGNKITDLNVWFDPSDREKMLDTLRQGKPVNNLETLFRRKDGTIVPTLFSARIINIAGNEHLLSTMKDITEINAMKNELRELATHDVLTNLPNRSLFVENFEMQQARAARSGEILGVAMIDFDDFKLVNDKFGHDVGDKVLISIAERLREFTRKGDHVARFGGDEFALLINGAHGKDEIENAMKRLMEVMEPLVEIENIGVKVNVSIGVSLYPADGTTHERLLKKADEALFDAKRSGKRAVKFSS